MSSSNKRNFKRRRNGRSHSVFNVWNRDKHSRGGELPFTADNDNYQNYGFLHTGQKGWEEKKKLSSSSSLRKLTKQTTSIAQDGGWNGDEISTFPLTLEERSRLPISPNWYQSESQLNGESFGARRELELMPKSIPLLPPIRTTSLCQRQQLQEEACRPRSPPIRSSQVLSVARLIRLLSLILRVTCISHYCSKLFSLPGTNQKKNPANFQRRGRRRKSSCRRMREDEQDFLPAPFCSGVEHGSLPGTCLCGNGSCSGMQEGKTAAKPSSPHHKGPFRKHVRCQINPVRSDFIYIIVFALSLLLPCVTPVITSNEVYSMDSSTNDVAEAEIAVPAEGVVGKRVDMTCDISSNRRDDSVYMVLWFRGDESIPIYSLDVRGKHFSAAKHWSAEIPFGKRGHFQTTSEPARLIVEPVKVEDQGIYRCRVDFRNSPSRETRLNLTIIVPPSEPQIFEHTGMNVRGEVGPYREGSSVELTCIVRDGSPPPLVLWYLNDDLVDSSYHVENENQVINHISVPNIQRSQHRGTLECRARNTVLIPPVSKTVTIELNLRPLSVAILQRHSQLSTNTQYEITCESWGSHPPPTMTWFLEGQELKGVTTEESRSSNTSVSRLHFSPAPDVDGKSLTCRAANPLLPGTAIEDFWQLKVVYSPILSLRLGSSLNPNAIKEGDDVYFECLIKANPPALKLSWYHNGQLLQHNRSAGVIVSNQSLALQKVTRPSGGKYVCAATNNEGEGRSNPVELKVMYAPACRNELSTAEGTPVIIAASRSEDVNITCEMDALPETLRFHWAHTNTVGEAVDLDPEIYTSQGSRSLLFYNVRAEEDFGMLLCWAQNSIGTAERPCLYQLVPADTPQPVENCSIINRTSTSVEITCEPGFDGGLPQSFYLEAFQAAPHDRRGLKFNISSANPTFSLTGLDPDGTFHFKIYSVNRKGKSSPSVMDNIALHYPAMQSAKVRDLEKTTIAIIIGAVSAVVLSVVSLIIFIVHRLRNPISAPELEKSYSREFRPSRRSSTNDELYHHNSKKPTKNTPMDMPFTATNDLDEEDPDLIPSSRNVKTSVGMGRTYSRLSNGEINLRYGAGHVEKIPLRSIDPDVPLSMEQHSALSNYATFRSNKSNGYGMKHNLSPRPIVSSTSGSFHGKPSSVVVNIDTRLIGQQLASNQLPESCV